MTTHTNANDTLENRFMASTPATSSKIQLWAGRILTGIAGGFLLVDGVMKMVKPAAVIEATVKLGYPEAAIVPLGIVLTLSALLYLFPRTAVLGAILLTGYLGGAVATHVHASGSAFEIVFPAIFGAIVWGGLWFRDSRIKNLLPLN